MYLIYGESYHLIEEEINKIVKKDEPIITMDLNSTNLEEIIKEATYVSMFQEQKYILVRNASFFTSNKTKEEDIELLLKYMENPVSLTTIIFTSYAPVDARKKIYKEFAKKYNVISVGFKYPQDIEKKVKEIITKRKYQIDDRSISYIVQACQKNFDLIIKELEKLFLYYEKPTKIEYDVVKEITSKTLIDNNYKFVDAIIKHNMPLALKILEDLLAKHTEIISLFMALVYKYRLLYMVLNLLDNNYSLNEIEKKLGLQSWQLKQAMMDVTHYSKNELKILLIQLADCDYRMKSGQSDPYIELKAFLLKTI